MALATATIYFFKLASQHAPSQRLFSVIGRTISEKEHVQVFVIDELRPECKKCYV